MNIENIQTVIAAIRAEDARFSMEGYQFHEYDDAGNACNTPSCICGWANAISSNNSNLSYRNLASHDNAGKWLGLDTETQDRLFLALQRDEDDNISGHIGLEDITKAEAIITLENLIETGKVDWSHCEMYRPRVGY